MENLKKAIALAEEGNGTLPDGQLADIKELYRLMLLVLEEV